jgi:hypothetical protein
MQTFCTVIHLVLVHHAWEVLVIARRQLNVSIDNTTPSNI